MDNRNVICVERPGIIRETAQRMRDRDTKDREVDTKVTEANKVSDAITVKVTDISLEIVPKKDKRGNRDLEETVMETPVLNATTALSTVTSQGTAPRVSRPVINAITVSKMGISQEIVPRRDKRGMKTTDN